jgi:hypothetical protein
MSYANPKKFNWKDIVAICIAVIVSIAYRCGGSGNFPRYFRPLAVGLGVTAVLWLLFGFHWSIFISAGASAGLSTTYFKKKGSDAKLWNWILVGLALSLALLPWAIFTHHLLGFGVRTIVLTGAIALWSEKIGNAVVEELGRGFLIMATLFLLLI